MEKRTHYGTCVIQSGLTISEWLARPPPVGVARPKCCPRCGEPARSGSRYRIISHGRRRRQVLGPAVAGGRPKRRYVMALRFRCLAEGCGAVLLVVPRGIVPGRQFSAAAIAYAMALWAGGRENARVRRKVSPIPSTGRRWRQLARWTASIRGGQLLDVVRWRLSPDTKPLDVAAATASVLAGYSGQPIAGDDLPAQAFRGGAGK
jgi:hypothetical protein